MKNLEFKKMFRQKALKAGSLMLVAALMLGGGMTYYDAQNPVPELVTFVDTEGSIMIEGEEVPLAGAKVTKSTKTKKKTKKIKMKKASKKTYKTKGKTTTTKKTSTKKSSSNTTTTETVTTTQVTNSYKKGSKVNTQVTTTKTTTTKTVTPKGGSSAVVVDSAQTVSSTAATTAAVQSGNVSIDQIAPMVGQNVKNAFRNLGFQIVINPSVSYSGLCDARTRTVTLKRADNTIYHELGHFVAFVAGNVDTSSAFKDIYNREKSRYNEYNKSYVLSSSSEYFAESYRNYILNPAALRSSRPETYAAIETALSRITDTQVTRILNVYGAVWNK